MKKIIENWNKWVTSESVGPALPMSKYVDSGMLHLYHYSGATSPSILLDPKRFQSGRNSWSMREYNISSFPRVFFYVDNSKTEVDIARGAPYEVSVSASDIYDLIEDPEGILERSIEKYAATANMHRVLKALAGKDKPHPSAPHLFTPIRDEGAKLYKGVYYTINDRTIPVVAWFDEIQASRPTEETGEREEV